jgi:hypothetical protein
LIPTPGNDPIANARRAPCAKGAAFAGAGRGLVDRLVTEDVFGEAPQLLALWADVDVSIDKVGEVVSTESAVRVGDRSNAQQWLHLTLEASANRRLASIAPIADQLPRGSAQGSAMLVEQAGDQEMDLVPQDRRPAQLPEHLRVGVHGG